MWRKWLAAFFAFGIAATSSTAAAATPQTIALRPGALVGWNVVLITLDATSAQRIGTYSPGMKTMPYFDGLARRGVIYEHAYTMVGETGPSHATILSGVAAAEHGVSHNGDSVEAGTPWLATELHNHDYFTAASTVAFFIDKSHGFTHDFDSFITIPNDKTGHPGAMSTNAAAADQAAALFDDLLVRGRKPFFCWIHLKGGHGPLAPIDPRFLQRFDRFLPADHLPPDLARATLGPGDKEEFLFSDPSKLVQQARAYYDANLAEADDALERIIEGFRSRGLAEKTLFIIMADHGESFDHDMLEEHGSSPWESTLRIPLIFYADSPRIAATRVRDRIASTIDLAPTIMDLLAIQPAKDVAGKSLLRAARTEADAASSGSLTYDELLRKIVSSKTPAAPNAQLKSDIADLERTGNFYWATLRLHSDGRLLKLIHYGSRISARTRSTFINLFDVAHDPAETVDLLQSGAKVRPTAAEMLNDARRRDPLFGRLLSDIAAGVLSNNPDAFTRGLSKEAIETLRSLGYIH